LIAPTDFTEEQRNNILWLTTKLVGLSVEANFEKLEVGPVVSGYYFKLGAATPVRKLVSMSEDFALSLGADKVNIQRVGGHVVIFIPNKDRKVVDYKALLHWYMNDETTQRMELPIPVGLDHRGNQCSLDLVDMPHILIAGSTGSGKSVFESSVICSLAYFKSSDSLHFYLVDTKRVDLPLFSTLPHVKCVADDLEKFHGMMSEIMLETRRRLNLLQGAGCRKIQDYHKLGYALPYMVIIMDEFGDLMELDHAAKKAGQFEDCPSVSSWIKQAVQIGRAAGVHIIACTQRSSVKVVSGDIKANLPCRIALRLPTGTDSRTILGVQGAENLLGKGDMLIQRPERDVVERFHGPFVSMNDIAELITNYEQIRSVFKG
jgi:S-DNA-T family DNA segregation ATPase FtsK/SpoIIIE